MKKKILLKMFFIICLISIFFINFTIRADAMLVVENNDILNKIEKSINSTIIETKNIKISEETKQIIENINSLCLYIETKDLKEDVKKQEALNMIEIGNKEIAQKVLEYQKQQEELKRQQEELKKKQQEQAVINELQTRSGMVGRLTIPSVGVNVALIKTSIYDSGNQSVVDARDSAAYMSDWGAAILIADHNNQGFNAMKSSVPNQTKAYIQTVNGTQTYICVNNIQGHNISSGLTDSNYRNISGDNSGGLIMYTCNENWQNITITYWQPTN